MIPTGCVQQFGCLWVPIARARSDVLPDGAGDKAWVVGAIPTVRKLLAADYGLLSREKQLPETLARAEEYTREALQWLIDKKR